MAAIYAIKNSERIFFGETIPCYYECVVSYTHPQVQLMPAEPASGRTECTELSRLTDSKHHKCDQGQVWSHQLEYLFGANIRILIWCNY